ncbi:carbohydrate-selective porin (OprB family) [Acidipila rosea]|uniref:Carbohydrate-selective porin (OprB family) n=1 Tax=Acidipila rosea TaxID=768535 RepID=A0A4R1LBZ2_9BACT|nr:carbohydrate-selective porin (OprB family) [Acidipila rosea]
MFQYDPSGLWTSYFNQESDQILFKFPKSRRDLCALVFLVLGVVPAGSGQTAPAEPLLHPIDFSALLFAPQNKGSDSSGASPEAIEEPHAADLTLFPHSDSAPWLIQGQSNIIFQSHPGFHSPYQGTNSFHGGGEYKTSLLGTLFLAYSPTHSVRYHTDLIVDFESAGGRGLSEALGLAGFTNLDVVRNPNLGSTPYLARGEIRQVIGLTDETVHAPRGPFSLAADLPVRRFEFRIGKFSLPDVFDINEVGSDSHLQFMDWTVDNDGAWDYAADTRGYTVGGVAEYDDRNWSFRYGFFAMPTVANGISLDWAFSRARGQNWEYEWRHSLLHGREGAIRILAYRNNAHMGNYREAVRAFVAGIDPVPDITAHERLGAVKYGFGWNSEQEITPELRLFSRVGWNEGQHESFAYTEVDQTVEFGGDYAGNQWGRPFDKIGIAYDSNAIKKDHQNYLKDGGLGFILGDGRLNYSRENILESYYNLHTWKGVYYALGMTHLDHPGYNRDRGPVWVESVRMHVDF